MKKFFSLFLIVVILATHFSFIPLNNEVQASSLQIKDVPVGSIVKATDWTFQRRSGSNYTTPNTANENIEWIVVDSNNHFKQSHYGNTGMANHVTLLSNEVIARYNFNPSGCSWGCASPWEDMPIRNDFLRGTFYNSMSDNFKNLIVPTQTKTGPSTSHTSRTVSNETVFLLSASELGYHGTWIGADDGLRIPYFPSTPAHTSSSKQRATGEQSWYWTRSPISGNSHAVWNVRSGGYLYNNYANISTHGVRPALNLKSETIVTPTGVWKTNQAGDNVQVYEIGYNNPPVLTVTAPADNQTFSAVVGGNIINVTGSVRHPNGSNVTVRVTLNGITRTQTLTNTTVARPFSRSFNVITDNIPRGRHNIEIIADDGNGGIDTATVTIDVHGFIEDNLYVTNDEVVYLMNSYSDIENDPQLLHQYLLDHNHTFFENSMGRITHHNNWVSPAANHFNLLNTQGSTFTWNNTFNLVGHYRIQYRGKDNPRNVPGFEEFQKWSPPTPIMNLYVHRRPVAGFTFNINQTTGAVTFQNTAYDLDRYSSNIGHGPGIQQRHYRHRDIGDTWSNGLPTNVRGREVEVEQRVIDFQGATDIIRRTLNGTGINQAPVCDFDYIPITNINTATEVEFINRSYDPDGDPLSHTWRFRLNNGTWNTFSSLMNPKRVFSNHGNITVQLTVNDGHVSRSCSANFNVQQLILNQPPTPGFNFMNEPYYVGDIIRINVNETSDADNDMLDMAFALYYLAPNGAVVLIERKNFDQVAPPYNFQFNFDTRIADHAHVGQYRVIQTVSDNIADPVQLAKVVGVRNLEIIGDVRHTEKWKEHHIARGCDWNTNCRYQFYSGEKFLLHALTTNQPINRVRVRFEGNRVNGQAVVRELEMSDTENIQDEMRIWLSQLYEESFADPQTRLRDGQATFRFTAEYANGTIRSDTVNIEIIASIFEAFNFHRNF